MDTRFSQLTAFSARMDEDRRKPLQAERAEAFRNIFDRERRGDGHHWLADADLQLGDDWVSERDA